MGKTLIGNRKHAEDALAFHRGWLLQHTQPGDWHLFSEGSMRTVMLHRPTETVYKVDGGWSDSDYDNAAELANARRLRRRRFKHVYIPATSGFNVNGALVLAMEYIVGPLGKSVGRDDHMEQRRELFERCRFADMHGANFAFIVNGPVVKIAPLDMGSRIVAKDDDEEVPDNRCLSCGDNDVWGRV